MNVRSINKTDFNFIVSISDRWWGGPSSDRTHPVFFYELGEHSLVADIDGEVIGFLLGFIADRPEKTGYIHLVGIHPDHRRQGVAKILYDHFANTCTALGVRRLKSITTHGNEGSIKFHKALGFDVTEDPDYAGIGRARVIFSKLL